MKKIITTLLVLVSVSMAFAWSGDTAAIRYSERIFKALDAQSYKLTRQQLQEVQKKLVAIDSMLRVYGLDMQTPGVPPIKEGKVYFCNENNSLMTVKGQLIAYFTFASDCQRAKSEVKTGYFCDGQNNLVSEDGEIIAGFTFASDCQRARKEILDQL